jgi:hypothetical protein
VARVLLYFAAVLIGERGEWLHDVAVAIYGCPGRRACRCEVTTVDGRMSMFTSEVTSHERVEIAG